MTFLSSCVTTFQGRNSTIGSGVIPASDAELQAIFDPARTMIDALARTMTARDAATAEHARRVQRYAVALAAEICPNDERMAAAIETAALLHDIGKLGIPDRLLYKPGPLSRDEYEQVKRHAVMGAEILQPVPFDGPLALIVRHHHENWDGSGYSDGLCGEAIPIGARVLSIVDCYDALTSERPYRRQLSHERALAMIVERRGTMYDPKIADAFVGLVQRMRAAVAPERTIRVPVHAFRLGAARTV